MHEAYLLKQADYLQRGLDPAQIERPDYSLPVMNDPYSLEREIEAAATDPLKCSSTISGKGAAWKLH